MNFLVLLAATVACLTQLVASSVLGIYPRPVETGAGAGVGLSGESIYNTTDAGLGAEIGGNVLGISGARDNGRLLAGAEAHGRLGAEIGGNPGASQAAGVGTRFGLRGEAIGNAGRRLSNAGAHGRLGAEIGGNPGASAAAGAGTRFGLRGGAIGNVGGGGLGSGIRGNVLGASKAGNNEGLIGGAGVNEGQRARIGGNLGSSAKAGAGIGNGFGVGARSNVRGGDLKTGIGGNMLSVNAAGGSRRLGVGAVDGFLRTTGVGDSGVRGPYTAGTGALTGSGISARNRFGHDFGGRAGAGAVGAGADFRRGTAAEEASARRVAPVFRSGFSRHGAGSIGESHLQEFDNAGTARVAGVIVGSRARTGGAGIGSDFKGQRFVRIGLLANQE